ncbi:MAG: SusD/RagB family nutrient-binding outer membrane lipoprotein [Sediminibacterium sp.]|nr:SusD/RagB family nutrient-binding outer membrane lipoprotein [Sediminibacterium sp.]
MKNIISKILVLLAGIVMLNGCGKVENSDLQNPNVPSPSTADVDLFLASVQSTFVSFYWSAYYPSAELSRMEQWSGPNYQNGYSATSFDNLWTNGYLALNNAQAMIKLAVDQKKYTHVGIGQVMQAYILGTLVDLFDSIPLTEALQGTVNLTPRPTSGAAVYAYIDTLLGSAIANFNLVPSTVPTFDNFYSGDRALWIRAANTFRLKFYNQQRLVNGLALAPKISNLVNNAASLLIVAPAHNFNFKYSAVSSPNSRHPFYTTSYRGATSTSNTGSGTYLNNYYMFLVGVEKRAKARGLTAGGSWDQSTMTVPLTTDIYDDPRRRYMFYRPYRTYAGKTTASLPCAYGIPEPGWFTDPTMPFCLPAIVGGYWGRDHGDNSGTPPDAQFRTAYGVYPGGGAFDNNAFGVHTFAGQGAQGAGIAPIWNSEFTQFVIAELALIGGQTAAAKTALRTGVNHSITNMQGLATAINYALPSTDTLFLVNRPSQINRYLDLVANLFDSAVTPDDKLDVVMKEYFIALWGNGIEAYNNLRRTGKPRNVQLPVVSEPGTGNLFFRAFTYPAVYVLRNSNAAPQRENPGQQTYRVWWDINTGTNNIQ